MAQKQDNAILQVLHPICCGIDVHKDALSACLVKVNKTGKGVGSEVKEFRTFTDDLIAMREWLLDNECPVVAMESTGVYWQPVYNILEGHLKVVLVNARHIKNLPGRKTDIQDSKWLASLLRNGLVQGSFIPPEQVRQWRDMTRLRKKHVETLADYKRRVHKLFESANIKLSSTMSDLFGTSGRNLMNLLLSNSNEITVEDVSNCLCGRARPKAPEIHRAIQGFFQEHHRKLLADLLRIIDFFEQEIRDMNQRIQQDMGPKEEELVSRLTEIGGIEHVTAHAIIAEIGTTLEAFHSSSALCSWAGLCPANNESAGKRRKGKGAVHAHNLKTIMVRVAWATIKTKGSYYREKYYHLKARLGAKASIVAIAHRLLKAIYYIIKEGAHFKDLGDEYLAKLNQKKSLRSLCKKAKQLGYQLVPVEA